MRGEGTGPQPHMWSYVPLEQHIPPVLAPSGPGHPSACAISPRSSQDVLDSSFWPGPRLVLALHSKVGPERCLVDLRPVSVAPPGLNLDDLGRLRGRPAATAARTGADPGGRALPTRVTSKPSRYAEPRPHFPARTRTSTPSCSAPKTLRARNEAG